MYVHSTCISWRKAFDNIVNSIFLNGLQSSFGIHGNALSWFHSYLSNRTQFVQIGKCRYSISPCPTGMPQGSVLGPLLFSLYISPIVHIVSSFGLLQQQYADDTQIYVAVSGPNQLINIRQLKSCLSALHAWLRLNGLALNPSKSEVILMGTRQRSASLPSLSSINVTGSTFHSLLRSSCSASPLISTLHIFPNHVSFTCVRYATYATPSLTMQRKPSPARSSGRGLTTPTPYWFARHSETSTGCSASCLQTGADCYEGTIRPNTQREH